MVVSERKLHFGSLQIEILQTLKDNYTYILKYSDSQCLVIDPGESEQVESFLNETGYTLTHILISHHHLDHCGGALDLKKLTQAQILAPSNETNQIESWDEVILDSRPLNFGPVKILPMECQGHTKGQILFWLPEQEILFSGDTLFAMGCGRLIEGTAEEMFNSLAKIKALPRSTLIFCGHEYTEKNLNFTLSQNPSDQAALRRQKKLSEMKLKGISPIPLTLSEELETNLFLKAKTIDEFKYYRKLRDTF